MSHLAHLFTGAANRRRRLAATGLLLLGLAGPAAANGPGALGVSPTHIILDGRTRTGEVMVINRGNAPATYRVSFQNLRMLESGEYQEVESPDIYERAADGMIRYSPRQVRLEPGKPQSIRLLLRKPANLPPGEYRSHLLVQQLPPDTVGNNIDASLEPDQLSVKMIATFGVSLPVIVREGELKSSAVLRDLRLLDPVNPEATKLLELNIAREGEASVRGDIAVDYQPPGSSKRHPVGMIKGISVLYPTRQRMARFHLTAPPLIPMQGGTLHLRYTEGEDPEKARELARAELALP